MHHAALQLPSYIQRLVTAARQQGLAMRNENNDVLEEEQVELLLDAAGLSAPMADSSSPTQRSSQLVGWKHYSHIADRLLEEECTKTPRKCLEATAHLRFDRV